VTRLAPGALVALGTAAAMGVALASPEHRARAVAAWLVGVGALAVALALRRLLRARPLRRSPFEAALAAPEVAPHRLRSLEQAEHDCIQGIANPVDLHRRLRPRLREVAAHRLSSRHGIDLDRRPDAARELLGDEAWEAVRPDQALPDELAGPRLGAAGLRRVLDRIEAV
jgi:hypothetical protein